MKVLESATDVYAELSRTKWLPPHASKLDGYGNLGYSCGCGQFHGVNSPLVTKVATALPVQFVLACPTHYTLVRMRGLFKIRAESIWTARRELFEAEAKRLNL